MNDNDWSKYVKKNIRCNSPHKNWSFNNRTTGQVIKWYHLVQIWSRKKNSAALRPGCSSPMYKESPCGSFKSWDLKTHPGGLMLPLSAHWNLTWFKGTLWLCQNSYFEQMSLRNSWSTMIYPWKMVMFDRFFVCLPVWVCWKCLLNVLPLVVKHGWTTSLCWLL